MIDPSDLDLLIHVVSDVVDRKARHFYKEGMISDLRQGSAFDKRWYEILQQFNGQNEVYGWHKTVFGKPLFEMLLGL